MEICELPCVKEGKEEIATLELCENEDYVEIGFIFNDLVLKQRDDTYFEALLKLREDLERLEIKLLCKGCSRNVYPSGMILSMGEGRRAYTLTLGIQAKMESVVDIFSPCLREEYATIKEQLLFFEDWISSLR